jgi:S-adenosylmethionine synthetase
MTDRSIYVESLERLAVEDEPLEVVERKGRGHPDSICDGIMEQVALQLGREYLRLFNRVAHFNVDKALLVAGRTEPRFGGGLVREPMRLILGGRAAYRVGDVEVPVEQIAFQAARSWLSDNLRFVDPLADCDLENAIKAGAGSLTSIYDRTDVAAQVRQPVAQVRQPIANDTSIAVGYAPLSEVERLVLAAERHLNSPQFKLAHPESGEDVKVLAIRRGPDLHVTVAMAFVDRFVDSEAAYFRQKAAIASDLTSYLAGLARRARVGVGNVELNTLDRPGQGEDGLYLTVLGTSAEHGDDGEVGRGNQTNGLIALNRPRSPEAAAGKNPVSHVGKLYSVLAGTLAEAIHQQVPGVRECYVRLVSQIGAPNDQPLVA